MVNTPEITGIEGIGHLAFAVRNMEASLKFYCGILGFKHAFTLRDKEGKPWIEYLKAADNQFVEFFYAKGDTVPVLPRSTNNHICLAVADIHETARVLEENKIELVIPVRGREGANWQCWCRDPEGNYIEFMYIHPNSFQATA